MLPKGPEGVGTSKVPNRRAAIASNRAIPRAPRQSGQSATGESGGRDLGSLGRLAGRDGLGALHGLPPSLPVPLPNDNAGAPAPLGAAGRPAAVEAKVPVRRQRVLRNRQANDVSDNQGSRAARGTQGQAETVLAADSTPAGAP
eukprot:13937273-Alexandrium_andersonii.AAC.1